MEKPAGPAHLAFSPAQPKSAEFPHASGARSGRVAAAPRRYEALEAVAAIRDGSLGQVPPRFIDVPARGDRLILERPHQTQGGFDVRLQTGALVASVVASSSGSHALATPDRFYADASGYRWTAEKDTGYGPALNANGEALALLLRGNELWALAANPGGRPAHAPPQPDYVRVELNHVDQSSAALRIAWRFVAQEAGVGAIDGAGRAVLALPRGRLVVLSPEGDEQQGDGVVALDAEITPGATDLSIVPPFALVLYGGGDAGFLAALRSSDFPASRLEARAADGSLAWSARLPFRATQPAMDGNGRVYAVGEGIAAFDMKGESLWLTPSAVPLRAQAFADGTLAVVRGSELQIVAPDGTPRQSLRAQEELTSAPAIGPDGAVWVASAKSLYVAR